SPKNIIHDNSNSNSVTGIPPSKISDVLTSTTPTVVLSSATIDSDDQTLPSPPSSSSSSSSSSAAAAAVSHGTTSHEKSSHETTSSGVTTTSAMTLPEETSRQHDPIKTHSATSSTSSITGLASASISNKHASIAKTKTLGHLTRSTSSEVDSEVAIALASGRSIVSKTDWKEEDAQYLVQLIEKQFPKGNIIWDWVGHQMTSKGFTKNQCRSKWKRIRTKILHGNDSAAAAKERADQALREQELDELIDDEDYKDIPQPRTMDDSDRTPHRSSAHAVYQDEYDPSASRRTHPSDRGGYYSNDHSNPPYHSQSHSYPHSHSHSHSHSHPDNRYYREHDREDYSMRATSPPTSSSSSHHPYYYYSDNDNAHDDPRRNRHTSSTSSRKPSQYTTTTTTTTTSPGHTRRTSNSSFPTRQHGLDRDRDRERDREREWERDNKDREDRYAAPTTWSPSDRRRRLSNTVGGVGHNDEIEEGGGSSMSVIVSTPNSFGKIEWKPEDSDFLVRLIETKFASRKVDWAWVSQQMEGRGYDRTQCKSRWWRVQHRQNQAQQNKRQQAQLASEGGGGGGNGNGDVGSGDGGAGASASGEGSVDETSRGSMPPPALRQPLHPPKKDDERVSESPGMRPLDPATRDDKEMQPGSPSPSPSSDYRKVNGHAGGVAAGGRRERTRAGSEHDSPRVKVQEHQKHVEWKEEDSQYMYRLIEKEFPVGNVVWSVIGERMASRGYSQTQCMSKWRRHLKNCKLTGESVVGHKSSESHLDVDMDSVTPLESSGTFGDEEDRSARQHKGTYYGDEYYGDELTEGTIKRQKTGRDYRGQHYTRTDYGMDGLDPRLVEQEYDRYYDAGGKRKTVDAMSSGPRDRYPSEPPPHGGSPTLPTSASTSYHSYDRKRERQGQWQGEGRYGVREDHGEDSLVKRGEPLSSRRYPHDDYYEESAARSQWASPSQDQVQGQGQGQTQGQDPDHAPDQDRSQGSGHGHAHEREISGEGGADFVPESRGGQYGEHRDEGENVRHRPSEPRSRPQPMGRSPERAMQEDRTDRERRREQERGWERGREREREREHELARDYGASGRVDRYHGHTQSQDRSSQPQHHHYDSHHYRRRSSHYGSSHHYSYQRERDYPMEHHRRRREDERDDVYDFSLDEEMDWEASRWVGRDMARLTAAVARQGRRWDALREQIRIPVIVSPYYEEEEDIYEGLRFDSPPPTSALLSSSSMRGSKYGGSSSSSHRHHYHQQQQQYHHQHHSQQQPQSHHSQYPRQVSHQYRSTYPSKARHAMNGSGNGSTGTMPTITSATYWSKPVKRSRAEDASPQSVKTASSVAVTGQNGPENDDEEEGRTMTGGGEEVIVVEGDDDAREEGLHHRSSHENVDEHTLIAPTEMPDQMQQQVQEDHHEGRREFEEVEHERQDMGLEPVSMTKHVPPEEDEHDEIIEDEAEDEAEVEKEEEGEEEGEEEEEEGGDDDVALPRRNASRSPSPLPSREDGGEDVMMAVDQEEKQQLNDDEEMRQDVMTDRVN
ncbi:hypothetical protein BGZ94_001209, partial [Podila epigama]